MRRAAKDSLGIRPRSATTGILLRAFGAEDRDRHRLALRDVVALDAAGDIVAQADGFGALDEAALGARSTSAKRQLPWLQKSAAPDPSVNSVDVPVMKTRLGS